MGLIRKSIRSALAARFQFGVAAVSLGIAVWIATGSHALLAALSTAPAGVKSERLARITVIDGMAQQVGASTRFMSFPLFRDLRERTQTLDRVACYLTSSGTVLLGDAFLDVNLGFVSHGFFELLGVRPALGLWSPPSEETIPSVAEIAVSRQLWTRLGGDGHSLGTLLTINGQHVRVSAVLPDSFRGVTPGVGIDLWLPIGASVLFGTDSSLFWNRRAAAVEVYARIGAHHTVGEVETEIKRIASESDNVPAGLAQPRLRLALLTGVLAERTNPMHAASLLLFALSLLLFIACCGNAGGLALVRITRQRHSFAIRLALGASRRDLVMFTAIEHLLLAIGAAFVAAAVSFGVGALGRFGLAPLRFLVVQRSILDIVTYSLAAALMTSLAPLFSVARTSAELALLGEKKVERPRQNRAQNALIAIQVGICLLLTATAVSLSRSARQAIAISPGFDPAGLMSLTVAAGNVALQNAEIGDVVRRLANRARELPSVSSVAVGSSGVFGNRALIGVVDELSSAATFAVWMTVGPGYFHTMRSQIVVGREWGANDDDGAGSSVLVNDALRRVMWPRTDPVGRCVRLGERASACHHVIGVVADSKFGSLFEEATPAVFVTAAHASTRIGAAVMRTRGTSPERIRHSLQRELGLGYVVRVQAADELLQAELQPLKIGRTVVVILAAVSVGGALLGMSAVAGLVLAQRRRELAIRVGLGALPATLLAEVSRQLVGSVIGGTTCGLLCVYWLFLLAPRFVVGAAALSLTDLVTGAGAVLTALTIAVLVHMRSVKSISPSRILSLE